MSLLNSCGTRLKRAVNGHQHHTQFFSSEHHHHILRISKTGQHFRVARIWIAPLLQRFLINGPGHHGGDFFIHGHGSSPDNILAHSSAGFFIRLTIADRLWIEPGEGKKINGPAGECRLLEVFNDTESDGGPERLFFFFQDCGIAQNNRPAKCIYVLA